ncbi:hypothetical protein HHI36_003485 [Cryptolaemus montrouzieri]|uniref:Phosphatidic acid phosphatase type 2/haloperoxidase domain-containing protein n=1 Tax=Cryptolaemus montrouzieri TaxID=559131 RepID=A0ABD2PDL0_9CUCU
MELSMNDLHGDSVDIEDELNEVVPCLAENKVMANAMIADQVPSPHQNIRLTPVPEKAKQDPATVKCRKLWPRRLRFTVCADIIITLLVFTILLAIEFGVIPQRKLGFRCGDPSISFPYTGDTISVAHLFVGSFLGALLLITFVEIVREKSFKDVRFGIVWEHYKEYLVGVCFVLLITQMAKAVIGEHRPHFFDVCRPDANEGCELGTFVPNYTCTNTAYSSWLVSDASKSFPSGHSSLSVFTSLFCAYVIQTRLPSAITGKLFKPFLIAFCLCWGIVCSLSRIADRRHHWWDVLSGVVLGILAVIFFAAIFHQKQKRKLNRTSEKSISSTMLLDVKSKSAASARV